MRFLLCNAISNIFNLSINERLERIPLETIISALREQGLLTVPTVDEE